MWHEFWNSLQLTGVLIISGCFLVSGFAKLRSPGETADTFLALRVHPLLRHTIVTGSYPWAELGIGLALLVAPAPAWWPVTLLAALLLVALTLLVLRVLIERDQVSCNCFGSSQPVTWKTLTRNLIFLGLAFVLLWSPLSASSPALAALQHARGFTYALALGLIVTVVVTYLTMTSTAQPGITAASATSAVETPPARQLPPLDLLTSDGQEAYLPGLANEGPMLLVYVKPACAPCSETLDYFATRPILANRVRVRLVERTPPTGPDTSRERLWDYEGRLATELGIDITPAAVFVAADATVPVVPAIGLTQIRNLAETLVAAVEHERNRLQTSASEANNIDPS